MGTQKMNGFSFHCLLLMMVLCSKVAFGKKADVCEELSSLACAPGAFADGTGSASNSEHYHGRVQKAHLNAKKKAIERFQRQLSNPENLAFRQTTIEALGLASFPDCQKSEPASFKSCNEQVSKGLGDILYEQLNTPNSSGASTSGRLSLESVSKVIGTSQFAMIQEDSFQSVQQELIDPQVSEKLKTQVFPQVQSLMMDRIKQMQLTQETEKAILNRLKSIKFAGDVCDVNVPSYMQSNAFYFWQDNTFHYCTGLLNQANSEFTVAHVIAHELSHSIDPCRIAAGDNPPIRYSNTTNRDKQAAENPFGAIIQCLRDDASVGTMTKPAPPEAQSANGLWNIPIDGLPPEKPTYNPNGDFCTGDQTSEAFCDWLAGEVLPAYIEKNHQLTKDQLQIGYSNTQRFVCRARTAGYDLTFTDHPHPADRIDRILLVNPKIRQQMGCPEKHPRFKYCNENSTVSDLKPSQPASKLQRKTVQ